MWEYKDGRKKDEERKAIRETGIKKTKMS